MKTSRLRKVLICSIILCLIFPYFYIDITYAVPVDENGNIVNDSTSQTNQLPSQMEEIIDADENYTSEDDGNLSADVDDDTGTILQILIEILMAIGDAIMSLLSSCMLGTQFEYVMPKWGELNQSNTAEANTTKTFTQEEIDKFKNNKDVVPELRYPQFKYTPEEIFKGEIDLFSIDFIGGNVVKNGVEQANSSDGWNALRGTISSWYRTLRYIAIVGLLSILIYIGIKIILSSSAGKKAEYKKSFINWVIAVFLIFTMHYIMSFIIALIQNLTLLLSKTIGNVKVVFMDKTFVTNFMGLARFESQQNSLINKIGFIVIYFGFITLTCKFTYIYFKRMLNMAFLTLCAPLIAMMYPLDKLEGGRAKGLGLWLKEYIFNGLLQPVHLLLYNILIGSAVQLATNNPIYAIIALFFLAEAEKLMKKIFGFARAGGGTVGGLAQTIGGLALGTSVGREIRQIFGQGQKAEFNNLNANSKMSLDGSKDSTTGFEEDDKDERFEKRYGGHSYGLDDNSEQQEKARLAIDKNIFNIRSNLTDEDLKNAKEDMGSFEDSFNYLKLNGIKKGKNQQISKMTRNKLKHMEYIIKRNEDPFNKANISLQYNDELSKINSNQLLKLIRDSIEKGDLNSAQYYFNILQRRMIENKFFRMHKGPQAFLKRKFSNLSDDDLQERYEEARAKNNKEDMLECEAEMALRNKNYQAYDEKLDEIERNRLEKNNEINQEKDIEQENDGPHLVAGADTGASSTKQNAQQNKQNRNENDEKQNDDEIEEAKEPKDNKTEQTGKKPIRTNINYNRNAQNSKFDRLKRSALRGIGAVAEEAVRPVWDVRKKGSENLAKIGGNVAKGTVQILTGVTTMAVQAGISATDGKYGPGEAMASFAGGFVAGGKLYNKGERAVKDMLRETRYGRKETRKTQIARDWSEREDIRTGYRQMYGSKSEEMIRRARDRFAREGITDIEDQKKLFRFSNYLRTQNNSYTQEAADREAVKVFRFRNNMNSTYGMPGSKQARKQFLDDMVQQNRSTKSSREVKILYNNLLKNAEDFEKVEDNQEYDYFYN